MCRINCSGGCPECAPDEHFKMSHWQIMSWLVNNKKIISVNGTIYCLDDDDCLLWAHYKNSEWHAVAGDGWASIFEDEVFYEANQAGLLWDLKQKDIG